MPFPPISSSGRCQPSAPQYSIPPAPFVPTCYYPPPVIACQQPCTTGKPPPACYASRSRCPCVSKVGCCCGPKKNIYVPIMLRGAGMKKGVAPTINKQQASFKNCNFCMPQITQELLEQFGLNSDGCFEEEEENEESGDSDDYTSARDDEDDDDDVCEKTCEEEEDNAVTDTDQYQGQIDIPISSLDPEYPDVFTNPCCNPFFPFGMGGLGLFGMCGRGGRQSQGGTCAPPASKRGGIVQGDPAQGRRYYNGVDPYSRDQDNYGNWPYGRGQDAYGNWSYGRGQDAYGNRSYRRGQDDYGNRSYGRGHDAYGNQSYGTEQEAYDGSQSYRSKVGDAFERETFENGGNFDIGEGSYGREPHRVHTSSMKPYTSGLHISEVYGKQSYGMKDDSIKNIGNIYKSNSYGKVIIGDDNEGRDGRHNDRDNQTKESLTHQPRGTAQNLSKSAGVRPYFYSNAELTNKSQAYLPEKYSVPPPHDFDKRIHPSRAPITFDYIDEPEHQRVKSKAITSKSHGTQWVDNNKPCSSTVQTGSHANNMRDISTKNANGQRSRSEPDLRKSQLVTRKLMSTSQATIIDEDEGNDEEFIPVYRTSTLTTLSIVERKNEPSEILVVQKPVQEVTYEKMMKPKRKNSTDNLDVFKDDLTNIKTKGKGKKTKCYDDPCGWQCPLPHSRRLHRLCSINTEHTRRLSQIHKPVLSFQPPSCPIRETIGSILRKKPPAKCTWDDEEKVPPFHEYCMTDLSPGTNRYPLLTQNSYFNDGQNDSQEAVGKAQQKGYGHKVETRGAKRKHQHC